MSLIRNSIPIQNKSMGDQINFMEWNRVVNQLSTQANMLTNATENIIENYFNFAWVPNNETPTPNGIDIIIIPDNSLGDLVTDEETLANYFNKEDSQYPPTEWKYRIIKYKRGTRVLEILSTGVMKFSQEEIEDLINSKFDEIENIIEEKYKIWDKPTPPPPQFDKWIKPLDIDSLGVATTFSIEIEQVEDNTQQIEVENVYGADGISQDDTPQLPKEEDQMEVILTNGRVEDNTQQIEVENIYGADGISQDDTPQLPKEKE